MMKKLILALFIIFGTLSFSAFDKVVVGIINDNYESPVISGTVKISGNDMSKGEFIEGLFQDAKSKLK